MSKNCIVRARKEILNLILYTIKTMLLKTILLNKGLNKTEKPSDTLSQDMLAKIKDLKGKFYTSGGTVNYPAIKDSNEFAEYRKLSTCLINYDLKFLKNENEAIAFWINLYNSIVVDGIVSLNIKNSVKEVRGFFKRIKYTVNGYNFSPDDIEHGILRANSRHPAGLFRKFRKCDPRNVYSIKTIDPRIHFALVCGALSCPPIKFYTPGNINNELDRAASNFVNGSEVIVIPEENKLTISAIFKWYIKDFGGKNGVLNFIEKYMIDSKKREFLTGRKNDIHLDYLHYNWNLHE